MWQTIELSAVCIQAERGEGTVERSWLGKGDLTEGTKDERPHHLHHLRQRGAFLGQLLGTKITTDSSLFDVSFIHPRAAQMSKRQKSFPALDKTQSFTKLLLSHWTDLAALISTDSPRGIAIDGYKLNIAAVIAVAR